jgi:hypothetical protein
MLAYVAQIRQNRMLNMLYKLGTGEEREASQFDCRWWELGQSCAVYSPLDEFWAIGDTVEMKYLTQEVENRGIDEQDTVFRYLSLC